MAEPRARRGFMARLARLRHTSADRTHRGRAIDDAAREVHSARQLAVDIARNLGFVLNTRKGCSSILSDFGLGDYEVERNTHRAVDCLRSELLAAARTYEPRMTEPSVRLLGRDRDRLVHFEIAGFVEGRRCALDVKIDTATRRVEVKLAGLEVGIAEVAL